MAYPSASGEAAEGGRPKRDTERIQLGQAIRSLRTSQGRTLADVAGAAGVSISLLSQVERGLSDPSLDSLRDIAEALGTAPFRLLADGHAGLGIVVRAGAGRRLALPDSDVEYEYLTLSPNLPFEIFRWTLRAGGVSAREPRTHGGTEAMLLSSGAVSIRIGSDEYDLDAGDLVLLDAMVPHQVRNRVTTDASGVSIVSPPYF
jgi:transcriptional regulator with XRE-family HTH domain